LDYHAEARASNVVTGVSAKYNVPTETARKRDLLPNNLTVLCFANVSLASSLSCQGVLTVSIVPALGSPKIRSLFKTFNRCAEPVLSRAEGFKTLQTHAVQSSTFNGSVLRAAQDRL